MNNEEGIVSVKELSHAEAEKSTFQTFKLNAKRIDVDSTDIENKKLKSCCKK